jgi:hypothetical protein
MNPELPFTNNDDSSRENFRWQSYMSSALTLVDQKISDQMQNLNSEIKHWLQGETDTFVYLPQDYSAPGHGSSMKPHEVYVLDRWRIAESDFIIMNFDIASFGVGQEAEIACSMGIPIIAFHYESYSVSRMIKGLPAIFGSEFHNSPEEGIITYKDTKGYEDLKGKLLAKVREIQQTILPVSTNVIPIKSFSQRLKDAIRKAGKTTEEVSKETGLTKTFLELLQKDYASLKGMFQEYENVKNSIWRPIPIERFANPGLDVLRRLSKSVNLTIGQLIGEDDLNRIWHKPLELASDKGVSLKQFLSVVDEVDYTVLYRKAARAEDEQTAAEEVANNIFQFVKKKENESK